MWKVHEKQFISISPEGWRLEVVSSQQWEKIVKTSVEYSGTVIQGKLQKACKISLPGKKDVVFGF